MKIQQFRNSILYTTLAILLMGVVFVSVSIGVIRPLLPVGSTGSRLVYGAVGVAMLFLIDPVRALVRKFVHLILQRRVTNYDVLEQQCMSVFVEQADFFATCEDIKRILRQGFTISEVQLVLKKDGHYQRIERSAIVPVEMTHPLIQFWKAYPDRHISRQMPIELAEYNARDMVYALPLSVEHRFIGWISFHDSRKHAHFFLEDEQFFHDIQPLLSVAFQRLRMETKLEQRIEELIALNRITQTMNSSLHIKETLESIMDSVMHLTSVDRALMYLSDDEGRFFTPVLGRGITEDVNMNFKVDIQNSIFRYVISSREPLVVKDIKSDPRINQQYAAFVKTNSFIAVPIVYKERVVGIIGVDNRTSKRPVTDINVDTLVTLANHAATAIANSKLYERTQRFNDELQKKVAEATVHLQKLVDMKSHFLTVASHQLRTPTTIVRGLLSMLVEDPQMPVKEQRTFVTQAYACMNRLERIISELLSATELEDDTVKRYTEDIDPEEFVQSVVNNLMPLAKERKVKLQIEKSAKNEHIQSDRFKLAEALSNLVDNAIRYTPKEGSVTVTTEYSDTHIQFHVTDTGIGLSPEDKEVIFEKFRRGTEGINVEPNGTGLGLYIVKRILEILQGRVTVESKGRNCGSTFTLTIPRKFTVVD